MNDNVILQTSWTIIGVAFCIRYLVVSGSLLSGWGTRWGKQSNLLGITHLLISGTFLFSIYDYWGAL